MLGQLSSMSETQPAVVAAAEAHHPRPRQRLPPQQRSVRQQQVKLDNDRTGSPERPEQPRPMIMVPTPVTLPPRQPPPMLRPAPSPYQQTTLPEATSSYSSPATHEGSAPAGDGDAPVFSDVAAVTVAEREADAGTSWRPVALAPIASRVSPSRPSVPLPLDGAQAQVAVSASAAAAAEAVHSSAIASVPSAGVEGFAAAAPPTPATPSVVEEAWDSPLGLGGVGLGFDDSRASRANAAGGGKAAATSGGSSHFSARALESGIGEVLRKLREPLTSGAGGTRGAGGLPSVRVVSQDSESRDDEAAAARGGDDYGPPEWVPRARPAFRSTLGEEQGERSGSSSISEEEEEEGEEGEGGRGRGGAGAEGFSLVSIVAGDIVRAQREKASRRRLEDKATEEAAAAASRAREQRQSKETLLAASEDAVAEAVKSAARVVAAEEAARNGDPSAPVNRLMSPVRGMEAVHDAMAALEERRAAGDDRTAAESAGVEEEKRGSSDRPDVWDSLLQSGPTVSPSRRKQIQGSPISSSDFLTEDRDGSDDCPEAKEPPTSKKVPDANGGVSYGVGGDADTGGEEVGGRNRRLSPAELQAQLLNELRLHDDLQDAELQADGLMAAQKIEKARQEARVAGLLLRRERVRADMFSASLFIPFLFVVHDMCSHETPNQGLCTL